MAVAYLQTSKNANKVRFSCSAFILANYVKIYTANVVPGRASSPGIEHKPWVGKL